MFNIFHNGFRKGPYILICFKGFGGQPRFVGVLASCRDGLLHTHFMDRRGC